MSFAKQIIDYHFNLRPDWVIPDEIEILFPYQAPETKQAMEAFYQKFYEDQDPRILILGINPGRFGAGVTGVPFTDPIRLESDCGIPNAFHKRAELSSIFVYEMIHAMKGPAFFYKHFYISSLSPLGFVKNGKNYNYYDDKALQKAVEPHILEHLDAQLKMGCNRQVAFSMGQGKNYAFFQNINQQHQFFEEIIPLPHPRWIMQYRRKRKIEFTEVYQTRLTQSLAIL